MKRRTLLAAPLALAVASRQPPASAATGVRPAGSTPAQAGVGVTTLMAWKGVEGDSNIWWNYLEGTGPIVDHWSTPEKTKTTTAAGTALSMPFNGQSMMASRWTATEDIFYNDFDGTTFGPQIGVLGAASSIGPAMCPWAYDTWMAWKGVTGDSRIWWNVRDRWGAWSAPQVVPGAFTSFGPALALLPSRSTSEYSEMHMVWKNDDTNQIFATNYDSRSRRWLTPGPIADIGTTAGVALAAPSTGGLVMAWKHWYTEDILYSRRSSTNPRWSPARDVPGAASSIGPSLTVRGPQVYMAWKGVTGDQRIWWARCDESGYWTAPVPVPGANTSFRPAIKSHWI